MSLSNAEQLVLKGIQLNDDATFSNFFPGKNAHILNFFQNPTSWFIYLWGNLGSGRTHLLHAICHQAKQQTAIYLPMSADENYLEPSIFDDLEAYDVVCIDDIHVIMNQSKWEVALFNLYNRLYEQGQRLIVTADRAPRELQTILPDLQSRLMAGLIFHLHSLSDDEKIAALQLRAEGRGMLMSDEVADFLLRRSARNLSDLFIILNKLDHASLSAQRRLTVPFVKGVLGL